MTLNTDQISEYLNEHLPYRLNSLRAWDLYISRREAQTYEEEDKSKKCYWEKEFLEPAFKFQLSLAGACLIF